MSIESVAVVGCGQMGLGIAEVVAGAGLRVFAVKATGGDPAPAEARLRASLGRRLERGKLDRATHDAILGRLTVTSELSVVGGCDLVLESAIEDYDLKVALLRRLERHMTGGAILASNTSSLPLTKLARALARPEQLLALHFFNPAPAMELVELGVTEQTAPGVIEAARAFCVAIGKTPVEVSASPGYVVNRLLVPYLLHAIETLEAGIAEPEAIDTAMRLGCRHPLGPLALCDLIGLDVVAAMASTLHHELRDPRYRTPSLLRKLVADRQLGRKSGIGIYDYRGAEPQVNPAVRLPPRPMPDAAE